MSEQPPTKDQLEFDGIPDDDVVVDFGKPTCGECGGRKSPGAGRMCRACFRRLASAKREKTPDGIVYQSLRDGERRGLFAYTQQGWTLPSMVKHIDWSKE